MRPAAWRRVWVLAAACAIAVVVLLVVLASGEGKPLAPSTAAAYGPPPANAKFDYQIGGDYPPPDGVAVVSRDWFEGSPIGEPGYSICYVNAFQTQSDEGGVEPSRRALQLAGQTWSSPSSATIPTGAASTSSTSATQGSGGKPPTGSSR